MKSTKQIALFFGSFNPIHIGHLIIANSIHQQSEVDEVWFVVSPQNPFKKQANLLDETKRLDLVKTAIQDHFSFRASSIEFNLPTPSYTIDTLTHLVEKYPNNQFHLIMGTDNLKHFHKWKNYEMILKNHSIFAYNRPGSEETQFHHHEKVTIIDGPLMHLSASMIRNYLSEGKSIRYLVTEPVRKILEDYHYYS